MYITWRKIRLNSSRKNLMNYFSVKCIIETFYSVDKEETSQSNYESRKGEYYQSEGEYNDESFSDGPSNCFTNTAAKTTFIVYWSSLMILLKIWLTCFLFAAIKNITVKGSQLIVKLICPNKHENIWKSQLSANRYSKGNLTLSAVILFSKNTFEKIARYFDIINV